jgi:4-amino-4-deoxy-L-arabinose transferase-like glycosyltransferase
MASLPDDHAPPGRRLHLFPALSLLLLAISFLLVVLKAWTLPITMGEAYTYTRWVDAPFSDFSTLPGYNNHPLNTLLCKLSVALFGPSEFTLRLPNVLLALLYFGSIYRIARTLFGRSVWLLLTVAVNCLNPLVLDHLAAARGYAMELALWT